MEATGTVLEGSHSPFYFGVGLVMSARSDLTWDGGAVDRKSGRNCGMNQFILTMYFIGHV